MVEPCMGDNCTFCRIVAGDLTKRILHQGDRVVVFLDRNQAARGHLLVVPKEHVAEWHQLDEPTACEMGAVAHRWAQVLVRVVAPEGYNLLMNNGSAAGQDVFHAHLHITPRSTGDGYYAFGGHHRILTPQEVDDLESKLLAGAID
jgi:histidine triad (HIT) family protein